MIKSKQKEKINHSKGDIFMKRTEIKKLYENAEAFTDGEITVAG